MTAKDLSVYDRDGRRETQGSFNALLSKMDWLEEQRDNLAAQIACLQAERETLRRAVHIFDVNICAADLESLTTEEKRYIAQGVGLVPIDLDYATYWEALVVSSAEEKVEG